MNNFNFSDLPWLTLLSLGVFCIIVANYFLTRRFVGRVYLSDRTLRKNDGTFSTSANYWEDENRLRIWGMVYKASLWGFNIASLPIARNSYGDIGRVVPSSLYRIAPLKWKGINHWHLLLFSLSLQKHYKPFLDDEDSEDKNICKARISWWKYFREKHQELSLPVEYADRVVSRCLRDVEPVAVRINRHTAVSLSQKQGCPEGCRPITPQQGEELMKVCYEFDHTLRCLRKRPIWDDCVFLGNGTALFGPGILDIEKYYWLPEGVNCISLYTKQV